MGDSRCRHRATNVLAEADTKLTRGQFGTDATCFRGGPCPLQTSPGREDTYTEPKRRRDAGQAPRRDAFHYKTPRHTQVI